MLSESTIACERNTVIVKQIELFHLYKIKVYSEKLVMLLPCGGLKSATLMGALESSYLSITLS